MSLVQPSFAPTLGSPASPSRSLARRHEGRQEGDLRRRIESVRSRRFPCCVTKRVRVDRSGDEQQVADVRPHAVCQKPPTAAPNHRASFGYIVSQEGTLIVRPSPRLQRGSSSVWESPPRRTRHFELYA